MGGGGGVTPGGCRFLDPTNVENSTLKFSLVSMGGLAKGLACEDPGVRAPIGASGNFRV